MVSNYMSLSELKLVMVAMMWLVLCGLDYIPFEGVVCWVGQH